MGNKEAGDAFSDVDFAAERGVHWSRRALAGLVVFGLTVVGLLAVAPVHRVAFAPGELRRAQEIVVLRHSSGGDVAQILAIEDERVAAGELILRLDDTRLLGDLERLEAQRARATVEITRLDALIQGTSFALSPDVGLDAVALDAAHRSFMAERADFESELAALDARIAEANANAAAAEAALESVRAEIASYAEQAAIQRRLSETQHGTRRDLLSAEARTAEAEQRLAEITGRRDATDGVLAQLASERRRAIARREADWTAARAERAAALADIEAALTETRRQLGALDVAAPISGRVLELGAHTAGDVLAPGGLVARIVPEAAHGGEDLVAEVRISPDDIGHVAVGDLAEITVTAFDVNVFGEITGRVARISPSSIASESGENYFRADIALEQFGAVSGALPQRLSPGMVVQAKLSVGEETMLGYLAEPVRQAFETAFTD